MGGPQVLSLPSVVLSSSLPAPSGGRYYAFDEAFVREVLGKKLSKGTKKDLDDISVKTGVTLKSCRRQVISRPFVGGRGTPWNTSDSFPRMPGQGGNKRALPGCQKGRNVSQGTFPPTWHPPLVLDYNSNHPLSQNIYQRLLVLRFPW